MSRHGDAESFGPYVFSLSPAETEAAAARFGLRAALGGGLVARHLAPLAAFALVMAFASILALTGLIGRRAGEAAVLLAAAAFMIQRLANHWRIHRARGVGRTAIEAMGASGALFARLDQTGVGLEGAGRSRLLAYADCEETEDAGGLIYFWPRDGAPIVLPARALAEGEAGRIVAQARRGMRAKRGSPGVGLRINN